MNIEHLWEDGQVPYRTLIFILQFYLLLSLKHTHTHTHTQGASSPPVHAVEVETGMRNEHKTIEEKESKGKKKGSE